MSGKMNGIFSGFTRFKKLFDKVGGKEILRQYSQGHVLLFALVMTVINGFSKKSLEIMRLAVNNRMLKRLRKQYRTFIEEYVSRAESKDRIAGSRAADGSGITAGSDRTEETASADPDIPAGALRPAEQRKVWVCWLQGMKQAPPVVQKCYESLKENITDREIVEINKKNYKHYVQFPDYIQKKIDTGVISPTHMSDLLRLELLIRYGGTWVDATVLCTGKCPEYMLNSKLFFFQMLKPGLDGASTRISSWFLTAERENAILKLTRALLYEYWKKNDRMVDYFLFHDFFELAIEAYPEEWEQVVPFDSSTPHILLLRLFDAYDADLWKYVREQSPVHKLTYKFAEEDCKRKGTYYDRIMNMGWNG